MWPQHGHCHNLAMSSKASMWRRLGIECGTWRCARRTAAGDVILGKGRHLACGEVFFAADRFVSDESFGHQEPVGRDAQRGVMMKPPPAASLIVSKPEVLLEILVVALDAPALVRGGHQFVQRRAFGQRGQPILDRLDLVGRPLHEQPLLGLQPGTPCVATGPTSATTRTASRAR